jgi:hypothetical protein
MRCAARFAAGVSRETKACRDSTVEAADALTADDAEKVGAGGTAAVAVASVVAAADVAILAESTDGQPPDKAVAAGRTSGANGLAAITAVGASPTLGALVASGATPFCRANCASITAARLRLPPLLPSDWLNCWSSSD